MFYSEDFLEGVTAFVKEKTPVQRPLIMKMSFLVLISLVLSRAAVIKIWKLPVQWSGWKIAEPVVNPNERPLAQAVGDAGEKKVPPFAKGLLHAHVGRSALQHAENKHPNPKWQSPLKIP